MKGTGYSNPVVLKSGQQISLFFWFFGYTSMFSTVISSSLTIFWIVTTIKTISDLGNWSAVLLAQSSPAGSVVMILMSKTYRNFLFNLCKSIFLLLLNKLVSISVGISRARRAQEVTVDSRRENGSPGEEEPSQRQE